MVGGATPCGPVAIAKTGVTDGAARAETVGDEKGEGGPFAGGPCGDGHDRQARDATEGQRLAASTWKVPYVRRAALRYGCVGQRPSLDPLQPLELPAVGKCPPALRQFADHCHCQTNSFRIANRSCPQVLANCSLGAAFSDVGRGHCDRKLLKSLVRTEGLEPSRRLSLGILSPVCLPVPPRPRRAPYGGARRERQQRRSALQPRLGETWTRCHKVITVLSCTASDP